MTIRLDPYADSVVRQVAGELVAASIHPAGLGRAASMLISVLTPEDIELVITEIRQGRA
jgi:hypothetical protein